MALTPIQKEWADNPSSVRVLLAVLPAFGNLPAEYFSTSPYTPNPNGSLPGVAFDGSISRPWTFRRSVGSRLMGLDGSEIGFGDIILNDTSGDKARVDLQYWGGRPIKLYWGSPNWGDVSDFIAIVAGIVDRTERNFEEVVIKLRDGIGVLDRQVLTRRYRSADVPTGDPSNAIGQFQPGTYGDVRNHPTVYLNPLSFIFGVSGNDGDVQTVRESGVVLTEGSLADWTQSADNRTIDLDNVINAGEVTCDTHGPTAPNFNVPTVLTDLILSIEDQAGDSVFELSDLDTKGINEMTGGSTINCGYFVQQDTNLIEVLDLFCDSVGAAWWINRSNQITATQVTLPSVPPVFEMTEGNISGGISAVEATSSQNAVVLNVRVSWSDLNNSDLSPSVTEINKGNLITNFRPVIGSSLSTDIEDGTKLDPGFDPVDDQVAPPEVAGIDTILVDDVQTRNEADRQSLILESPRRHATVACLQGAAQIDLMDVVRLSHVNVSSFAPLRDEINNDVLGPDGAPIFDGFDVRVVDSTETYPSGSVEIIGWY